MLSDLEQNVYLYIVFDLYYCQNLVDLLFERIHPFCSHPMYCIPFDILLQNIFYTVKSLDCWLYFYSEADYFEDSG